LAHCRNQAAHGHPDPSPRTPILGYDPASTSPGKHLARDPGKLLTLSSLLLNSRAILLLNSRRHTATNELQPAFVQHTTFQAAGLAWSAPAPNSYLWVCCSALIRGAMFARTGWIPPWQQVIIQEAGRVDLKLCTARAPAKSSTFRSSVPRPALDLMPQGTPKSSGRPPRTAAQAPFRRFTRAGLARAKVQ